MTTRKFSRGAVLPEPTTLQGQKNFPGYGSQHSVFSTSSHPVNIQTPVSKFAMFARTKQNLSDSVQYMTTHQALPSSDIKEAKSYTAGEFDRQEISAIDNDDESVAAVRLRYIYLGDHLTRSWTRDERRGSRPGVSPVLSEPGNRMPVATPSVYQIKHSHPPISRTRSSLREPRGSRRNWVSKSAIQTVTPEELHRWKQSFDNLLQSPVGSKLFRIFLESEIAEENLLFWEACEELKQMKKEKRMQKLIQNIFDDYISVYSPREINIDYKMREDIVEQLNNSSSPDPEVFKDAQMQIYHLMHRDSYPRFLASAQTIQETLNESTKRKGSKRQHREAETTKQQKVKTKSRVLCCYGNNYDDNESVGQFIQMEEQERQTKVMESPKTPMNGQTNSPQTVKQQLDKDAEHCAPSDDPTDTLSPTKNTVPLPKLVEVDVAPPGAIETSGQLIDCPTDTSSKRESGIEVLSSSTHCEDDVEIKETASTILHVAPNTATETTTTQ
ncbi:uncharacterized protein LOC120345892 isoform X2 [Styela clava]